MLSPSLANLKRPSSPLEWLPFFWGKVLFSGQVDDNHRLRWQSILWLLILPAMMLYPCIGFHLFEPDEGRYAQIPKEMFESGNWVVPTLQGEPYLDKPPLMYWLVALSYSLFGVSEIAARLIPALSVHLTILAVYGIGRLSIGERGAFWAALLLALSPGYVSVARLLLLDGLLTFCITMSVLSAYEAVRTGKLRWNWWLTAAVFSGLGFLTKGPISELLLFPPLIAMAFLDRRLALINGLAGLAFASIVFAINLPWYVAIYLHEPVFLKYFFWEHNVMRFLQPFDHLQPVWYYLPILLGGFLPGVIVAVGYLYTLLLTNDTPEQRPSKAGSFWLIVGLWCLFFFSCSGSKLPTYILPAFPPLCLALGEYIARFSWRKSRLYALGLSLLTTVLIGLHWYGIPWYALHRSPMGQPELVMPYIDDPDQPVFTYPRHIDSVAFYSGRADLIQVRSKELNQFFVDSHFRERTVILFTHDHSLQAFREAMPPSLSIVAEQSFRRSTGQGRLADKLVGATPWGLCDIAVVSPNGTPPRTHD